MTSASTKPDGWMKQHGQTGVRKIVSPAMAGVAAPVPNVDCSADPSTPGNSHFCAGWLSMFKKATLTMTCQNFAGKATNCWDAIDSIQIHACVVSNWLDAGRDFLCSPQASAILALAVARLLTAAVPTQSHVYLLT